MQPQTQIGKNSSGKPAFNFNFGGLEEKESEDSLRRKKPSSKGMSDANQVDLDDDDI